MSKARKLWISVLTAIMSVLFAFAAYTVRITARADGGADEGTAAQIDVSKINITTGNMNPSIGVMLIDFGLNSQNEGAGMAEEAKQTTLETQVILTRSGKQISFARYLVGQGKIGVDWSIGFKGDENASENKAPQEGDTLTLKSGLEVCNATTGGFMNWYGTNLETIATLSEDVTLRYTCGGWFLPGEGPASIAASDVTVWGQSGQFGVSADAVVIDFGLNSTETSTGYADGDREDLTTAYAMWQEYNEKISLKRNGEKVTYFRYIVGQGKVAFDCQINIENNKHKGLQRGDVLTLPQGLVAYNGVGNVPYGFLESVTPIGVLSEDVTLVYNGTAWQAPVNATTVTIENEAAIQKLMVGSTVTMQVSTDENALEAELPVFSIVSGEEYASVDQKGVITGIAQGEVTVKVQYAEQSAQITFTVQPRAAVTGLTVDVSNYQTATDNKGGQKGDQVVVKNGKAYLRAYLGEAFEPNITAGSNVRNVKYSLVYGEGIVGSATANVAKTLLAQSGENFTFVKNADADTKAASWGKYTFTATGAQGIPVSVTVPEGETNAGETVTGILPVWVYEAPKALAPLSAAQIASWGDHLDLPFGAMIDGREDVDVWHVQYTQRNILKYGLFENPIIMHGAYSEGEAVLDIYEVGHITNKQFSVRFKDKQGTLVSVKDFADVLPVGTVMEFTENFRFYELIDGDVVAIYKLTEPAKYVWTGSAWADFEADATDFTVASELTVPLYAKFTLGIAIEPENAYMSVTCISDNPDVIEITDDGRLFAKSNGTAHVTVSARAGEEKTVTITVTEEGMQRKIVLANDRTFRVEKGGTLDLGKIRVKVSYGTDADGKDYCGDEITLGSSGVTATVGEYDFTKAGKGKVTITVSLTDNGQTLSNDIQVNVEVPEVREMYPSNFTSALDQSFLGNNIAVYFEKTYTNQANVYLDKLTEAQANSIKNYIEINFPRDGAEVNFDAFSLTQIFCILPYTGTNKNDTASQIGTYKNGDSFTLKAGLAFYGWFGDTDRNNVPVGEGEYIKVGELKYDVVFAFTAGKWNWQIAPADGVVLEEKVTVGIGEQHRANVEIRPAYATHGEWYYTVNDTSIATVDSQGLISGKKMGKTSVTAVLKDRDENVIKTVEFEIEVTDSIKSLQISANKEVVVEPGSELDIAKLIADFGVKGNVVMASGTVGKEVDLSKAKITGYKADQKGKQTITFRVNVDGKSVTGTLEITVGTEKKGCGKGCGSSISATASLIGAGVIALTAAVVVIRRRKDS